MCSTGSLHKDGVNFKYTLTDFKEDLLKTVEIPTFGATHFIIGSIGGFYVLIYYSVAKETWYLGILMIALNFILRLLILFMKKLVQTKYDNMDPFKHMPVEVVEYILSFLDETSLINGCKTYSRWNYVLRSSYKLNLKIEEYKRQQEVKGILYKEKLANRMAASSHYNYYSNMRALYYYFVFVQLLKTF